MMRGVDLVFQFKIALQGEPADQFFAVLYGFGVAVQFKRKEPEPDLDSVAVDFVNARQQLIHGREPIGFVKLC